LSNNACDCVELLQQAGGIRSGERAGDGPIRAASRSWFHASQPWRATPEQARRATRGGALLATGSRPHELETYPSVRQPNTVAVDPASGRVIVTGKVDGVLQLLDPR